MDYPRFCPWASSIQNLYLFTLHSCLEHYSLIIEGFANDHQLIKQFLIQLQSKALGPDIQNCLTHLSEWMRTFLLKLNPTKTKILVVASPNIQEQISIHGMFLDGKCIRFASSARNLGVLLDNELSFKHHIANIIKASYMLIKKLTKIQGFLTEANLAQIVSSDIFSCLDYCNTLFYGINND